MAKELDIAANVQCPVGAVFSMGEQEQVPKAVQTDESLIKELLRRYLISEERPEREDGD